MIYKPASLFFFCLILCIGLISSRCHAQNEEPSSGHCITQYQNGSINWTTGEIIATGKASPKGNKEFSNESIPGSARTDANRHIINILKQIKINDALTIEKYASKNDIILAGIEKTARDAVIIRQYYTSDLAVEIMARTSIMGGFLQLVLPDNIRHIPEISPEFSRKSSDNDNVIQKTGMIVDAREIDIEPVLNPVITSEQGHAVYSGEFISREFAVKNGVCKYICTLDDALKDKRIGKNPLIFKALRREGGKNSAIIISTSDYLLLEKTTERHVFLKECKVIIVKGQ